VTLIAGVDLVAGHLELGRAVCRLELGARGDHR
jgi:hypothetical protein